jgi:pyrophosphate--fructose-6-phosphate 1-phosphotransferase
VVLTAEALAPFRNQGGFHLLGRSVDKIRTEADYAAALAAAEELQLDGLVLLGGTFTNTDAGACVRAGGQPSGCGRARGLTRS